MINNKGQVVIYSMMLGLVIIILALALAPAGQSVINDVMNKTSYTNYSYEAINSSGDVEILNGTIENIGLNCGNETISMFDKATCNVVDFSTFYIFGGLILIAGAVITAKVVFS